MSGYGLYDPDQSAVDTRWIQPSGEAFRVSLICLRVLCHGDGCILDDRVAFHRLVNALSLCTCETISDMPGPYDAQANLMSIIAVCEIGATRCWTSRTHQFSYRTSSVTDKSMLCEQSI